MSTKKGEQALTDINKASTVVKNAKTHIKKVKLATNENEAQKSSNNQEKVRKFHYLCTISERFKI